MIKNSAVLIMVLLVSIMSFASSKNAYSEVINGKADLFDVRFKTLEVNGPLKFKNIYVEDLLRVNGAVQGTQLECNTLKVNGLLKVKEVKSKNIEINGSFEGHKITIENNITVNGNLNVQKISVLGNSWVNGSVIIDDGQINYITIISAQATFTKCSVGNIIMKKAMEGFSFFGFSLNKPKIPILELKESNVAGDVIFETEGEVHLLNNSIVHGNVIGAKVIRQNDI